MKLPEILIRQSKHLNAIAAKANKRNFTQEDIKFFEKSGYRLSRNMGEG
jgi:hypothetical protein